MSAGAGGLAGVGGPGCSQADSRLLSSDDILGKEGAAWIVPGLRPTHHSGDSGGGGEGRSGGGPAQPPGMIIIITTTKEEERGEAPPPGASPHTVHRGLTRFSLELSGQRQSRAESLNVRQAACDSIPPPCGLPFCHRACAHPGGGEGGRAASDAITPHQPAPHTDSRGGRLRRAGKSGDLESRDVTGSGEADGEESPLWIAKYVT